MAGRVDETFLAKESFSDVAQIHPSTVNALRRKQYLRMTRVQALTIPLALNGADVVAKAQTGTGKTIAFLIPVIQSAVRAPRPGFVSGLILAPTRELAIQIHTEAEMLLVEHKSLTTAVMIGGTNMTKDQRAFARQLDILVATPGRLIDHLTNTPNAAKQVGGAATFVLDEADRMLDMGFRPDLERIVAFLTAPHQTLLFSATIAPEVIELAPKLLQSEFMFADAGTGKTVLATTNAKGGKNGAVKLVADDPFATAKQVTQQYIVVEQDAMVENVVNIILRERQIKDHKVVVFFVTARLTQLFAELLEALGCPVLEIHSRKSQGHRLTTSDKFRDNKNVVMFSSDVTARGMDYPDVSLVLQVGLPSSAEQYVHRLGRTGRAGMQGRGVLLLMPEEKIFLKSIERLAIQPTAPAQGQIDPSVIPMAMSRVRKETRAMAYSAWLGFYNSFCSKLKWSKEYLVQRANQFALTSLCLSSVPPLQKKTIGKMGLKGVQGLVIENASPVPQQPGRPQPMPQDTQRSQAGHPNAAQSRGSPQPQLVGQQSGARGGQRPQPQVVGGQTAARQQPARGQPNTTAPSRGSPQPQVVGGQVAAGQQPGSPQSRGRGRGQATPVHRDAAPVTDTRGRGRGNGGPQPDGRAQPSPTVASSPNQPSQASRGNARGPRGARGGYSA